MTQNEYQKAALSTCLDTCRNEVYGVNGLLAEVGEYADKIAKWARKGICRVENNRLVFNTSDPAEVAMYRKELAYELGDIKWFIALNAYLLGYSEEEVAQMNIDKLADRQKRGVIDGNGDHR